MSLNDTSVAVTHSLLTGHDPRLTLHFDGAASPLLLLQALEDLGWQGLKVLPPPASAIDWSTPDPTSRSGYRILSHEATTSATLRPGIDARPVIAETERLLATPDQMPPRAAAPDVVRRLVVCEPLRAAAAVDEVVAARGSVVDSWTEQRVRRTSYRGQVAEDVTHVAVLRVSLPADQTDVLTHLLAPAVLDTDRPRPADAGPAVEIETLMAPTAADHVTLDLDDLEVLGFGLSMAQSATPPDVADVAPPPTPAAATVTLTFTIERSRETAVTDLLSREQASVTTTTHQEVRVMSYRGVKSEQVHTAVAATAVLPAARVEETARRLTALGAKQLSSRPTPSWSVNPAE